VPDFTPVAIRHRSTSSAAHIKLPAPAFATETTKLPAVLGAPRYSHLLEEARTLGQPSARVQRALVNLPISQSPSDESAEDNVDDDSVEQSVFDTSSETSNNLSHGRPPSYLKKPVPPPSPSIGSRMKGFFFSYLSSSKVNSRKPKPHNDGTLSLPPPPPDLANRSREPISTPISKLPPAPAHPKDLVELQHLPTPAPSRLPRPLDPKRLVDLRHVEPEPAPPRPESRARRSSGTSVKDLVRAFEDHDSSFESELETTRLRRMKSGELRVGKLPRPAWKP